MDPRRAFDFYFVNPGPVQGLTVNQAWWIAAQRTEAESKRREEIARLRARSARGVDDASGGHHHGHHHHGGHRRGGRFGPPEVLYVQPQLYDYDYCPPGFYLDEWGFCRRRPVEAGALPQAASIGKLALDKAWPAIDPQSRTFSQAIVDSSVAAASKNWPKTVISAFNLIAMIAGSALLSSAVKDDPKKDVGLRAGTALDRTWEILAKRVGYKGEGPEQVTAENPSSPDMRAALPILEIVIIVVAVAALAGVYAFAIWKASEIIERQLSINAEEQELIRLHSEWQKIVDRHVTDPNLPWTSQELDILKSLEDRQKGISAAVAPPPPAPPITPLNTTVLAGAALVLGAGYYFFLRKPKV